MYTSTLRHLFFLAFFILSFCFAQAQDYIYRLDGEVITARVESLAGKYIHYKIFGKQDGGNLHIAKTAVDRVKMANGTELWFNRLPEAAAQAEDPRTAVAGSLKPPVAARKLNKRYIDVMYPIQLQVFGGVAMPGGAVSSFERGYTLGMEYANYYTNHLAFVGHVSGTYNSINYIEQKGSLQGGLVNSWAMLGGRIGTGALLQPLRFYGQATAGGNYMLPLNGLEQVNGSVNLAYSGGGGVIIADLVNLGVRYHNARQKISTPHRTEVVDASCLLFTLGIQF